MHWTEERIQQVLPKLTPEERAEVDAILAAPELLSFREFVEKVNPRYEWYDWCELLARELQMVADGETNRLMVWAPPQHGKSHTASELFPAYWLYRNPEQFVGLCSFGAEWAHELSGHARDFYAESAGIQGSIAGPKPDSTAAKRWSTTRGGGMWAAGRGGQVTGRSGHLLIVDDPLKDAEEASSDTVRRKLIDWYGSTFYTRLQQGGAVVIIHTRWHEEDLSGYLLERERDPHGEPEHWRILDLPAFAGQQADFDFPATCTVVDDPREPGEPLCPERYDEDALRLRRSVSGSHWWAAMFEQRPTAREGNFFRRSWFEVVDELPDDGKGFRWCRYWDKAATPGAGDWTAGCLMGRKGDEVVIADVVRVQESPGERERTVSATLKADGKGAVTQVVEQEPGASGKDAHYAMVKANPGYTIKADRPTGPKELRADALATRAETQGIKLLRGNWNLPFIDELCSFPHGAHDDQVDAASGAYRYLTRTSGHKQTVVHW